MKVGTYTLSEIALAEQTPVVEKLLEIIMAQQKELEGLKEEIQKPTLSRSKNNHI